MTLMTITISSIKTKESNTMNKAILKNNKECPLVQVNVTKEEWKNVFDDLEQQIKQLTPMSNFNRHATKQLFLQLISCFNIFVSSKNDETNLEILMTYYSLGFANIINAVEMDYLDSHIDMHRYSYGLNIVKNLCQYRTGNAKNENTLCFYHALAFLALERFGIIIDFSSEDSSKEIRTDHLLHRLKAGTFKKILNKSFVDITEHFES